MAKTIESEILDVYGASGRKRGEDDQTYWARLVQISVEGSDDQWHQLEAPAQEWINAGVLAKKQGTEYIPFPDAPKSEPEPEKEPEDRFRVREVKAKVPEKAPEKEASVEETPPSRRRRSARQTPAAPAAPAAPTAPVTTEAATAPVKQRRAARGARGNGKKPGVYRQTQEYVVKHPNASTQDIIAALTKKGLDPQQHTVQSVRGHTRDTLKLVQTIKGFDMGIEL